MATTHSKRSKLTHYMKAPFRALIRARDMYVNGMSGCAGRVRRGRVISSSVMPRRRSHVFHNSTNTSSRQDDYSDLIHAASQGRLGALNGPDVRGVPRSQSVAVGVGISRIDEDEACDFSNDVVYPSSQSHAIPDKRQMVGAVGA